MFIVNFVVVLYGLIFLIAIIGIIYFIIVRQKEKISEKKILDRDDI